MRIGGLAPPLLAPGTGPGASTSLSSFQRLSQYRLGTQRMMDIRRAVLDVNKILGKSPLGVGSPGQAITVTGSDLRISAGLDLVGTKSTLTSTAQVNAAGTSFDDRTPEWDGSSDVPITLDGTWTGTGDRTLTFSAKINKKDSPATLPTGDKVEIDVIDSVDGKIDTLSVGNNQAVDTTFTLSNGMTATIGAGTIIRNEDTFAVNLTDGTGSALDRTKPFNGVGDNDAILEDPHAIVDGFLTINGTNVAINASDSLDNLLDRINAASGSLGVTAAYDDATERITLTSTSVGPGAITLGETVAGNLAALKLDGASTVPGTDPEDEQLMAGVTGFATVGAGTITINEQTVAVDPSTQSLQDVLDAINALDGVTASLADGKISISGEPGVDLVLSDTSGLLALAGIATGVHQAVAGQDAGLSTDLSRKVAKAIRHLASTVDAFVADQMPGPRLASGIQRLRSGLATEFASVFESEGGAFTALGGMRFNFSSERDRGVSSSLASERRLTKLLDEGDKDTLVALLGDGEDEPGLLDRLDDFTRKNLAGMRETLGPGSFVDVSA